MIDKTGVAPGNYNFTLEWSESRPNQLPDDTGPSLFKALQEQLGLKLEVKKMPTEAAAHVDRSYVDHDSRHSPARDVNPSHSASSGFDATAGQEEP